MQDNIFRQCVSPGGPIMMCEGPWNFWWLPWTLLWCGDRSLSWQHIRYILHGLMYMQCKIEDAAATCKHFGRALVDLVPDLYTYMGKAWLEQNSEKGSGSSFELDLPTGIQKLLKGQPCGHVVNLKSVYKTQIYYIVLVGGTVWYEGWTYVFQFLVLDMCNLFGSDSFSSYIWSFSIWSEKFRLIRIEAKFRIQLITILWVFSKIFLLFF